MIANQGACTPIAWATCTYCASSFAVRPRYGVHARGYCGTECSKRGDLARRVAKGHLVWLPGERECTGCGALSTSNRHQQCDECRLKAKRTQKERERRRRKALEREAIREPYTLAEIAERDGLRCGLCRRKVVMDLPHNHPRSATIDHVVPISISRDDTRANVQLAHRDCNMAKGARDGGQQLALIG